MWLKDTSGDLVNSAFVTEIALSGDDIIATGLTSDHWTLAQGLSTAEATAWLKAQLAKLNEEGKA